MGFFDSLSSIRGNDDATSTVGGKNSDYGVIEITPDLAEELRPPDSLEDATHMRPYKDDGGVVSSREVLTKIHDPNGPGISFELSYSDTVGLRVVPDNEDIGITLRSQLQNQYPNSDFIQQDPDLMGFRPNRYLAGAKLTLKRYAMYPIENDALDGFDNDPLGGITSQMAGLRDSSRNETEVVVQIQMEPAEADWNEGINGGPSARDIHYDLNQTTIERSRRLFTWETIEHEPSPVEEKAADVITKHAEKPAWKVNVYVYALSTDPEEARQRTRKTTSIFSSYYQADTNQGFEANPLSGSELRTAIKRSVNREFEPTTDYLSDIETVGLFHLPKKDEMNDDNMVWSVRKNDGGVPAGTPQFEDVDEIGYYDRDFPRTSWQQYVDDDYDWPYSFTPAEGPDARTDQLGHEVMIERKEGEATLADDEEIFAGALPRAMIENHQHNPNSPYFVGFDDNGREVPILQKELCRHILGLGQTGAGKSTTMTTINTLHFNRGKGGIVIDPGGEDTFQILMALHPDRFEDVHIMDAGSDFTQYRVGLNFLETYRNPGDPGFHSEVDSIVGDLLPLLDADQYQRMKGVASHIFRGLIEADYYDDTDDIDEDRRGAKLGEGVRELLQNDPEKERTYTIKDAYDILSSKENREEWYNMIVEQDLHHLESYAQTLAEMDDDDNKLEPLLRRLKEWLESPNIRPFVAQRESTLSLSDIVLNGKILIVKCDTANKEKRQMVASTIARKAWSVVLSMPSPKEQFRMEKEGIELPGEQTHEEYDGYDEFYMTIDEFHSVVTDTMDIEQMLAEARKRKFGLFLLTQQLNQLPNNQVDELIGNLSTVFAWDPGNSSTEKSKIAGIFPGISKDELTLDRYHAWTMITDKEGSVSEPFVSNMFPPAPPRNSMDTVHELMKRKEREHGVKKDGQERMGPPPRFDRGESADGEGGTGVALTDDIKHTVIKTLFDLGLQQYADAVDNETAATQAGATEDTRYVNLETLRDHLVDELNINPTQVAQLFEKLGGTDLITIKRDNGEMLATVTASGKAMLFDTGDAGNSGKDEHRWLLRRLYIDLTMRGFETELPTQEGEMLPDAVARPPIDTSADDLKEAKQIAEELAEQYPLIYRLTDGGDLAIEAESKTLKTKPAQTCINLRKAMENGTRALFAVPEGPDDNPQKWAEKCEALFDDRNMTSERCPSDATRRFYTNDPHSFHDPSVGKEVTALSPDTDARFQWVELNGDIVLRDDSGNIITRYESPSDYQTRTGDDYPAYYDHNESEGVYTVQSRGDIHTYESKKKLQQDWSIIYDPFIPAAEFDTEPTTDDWDIVIVPDDETKPLQHYSDGEQTPLRNLVDAELTPHRFPTASTTDTNESTPTPEDDADSPDASDRSLSEDLDILDA